MSDQAPAYPKRLIEVDLPIARISAHARREKSIRHGHISTLHIWWARRPLAACRAVICAALWPDPADPLCPDGFREAARRLMRSWAADQGKLQGAESFQRFLQAKQFPKLMDDNHRLRQTLLDFIADFADWDNSTVPAYLETSRALTHSAHESLGGESGSRPLLFDPFAGGGSIPLEALRVGADAFASDLNPIPVLLNKVVLEYIPKYGQRLADEVRKWGTWIKDEAEKELAPFYSRDPADKKTNTPEATPIAYLWARTILSEAPGQGDIPVEVPLMRSLWLAKKAGRRRALRWVRDANGKVRTLAVDVAYFEDGQRIVKRVERPLFEIFEPTKESDVEGGTVARGSATCPVTGYTTKVDRVRAQLKSRRGGAADARLFCVVTTRAAEQGRFYRLPTEADREAFDAAALELERREKEDGTQRSHKGQRMNEGISNGKGAHRSLVPDEVISLNELRRVSVPIYGMERWGDLFSPRQALALTTLARLVREVGKRIMQVRPSDPGLAEAVVTGLTCVLGKVLDRVNCLARWEPNVQCSQQIFGRQAIGMVWDYGEPVAYLNTAGSWPSLLDVWVLGTEELARGFVGLTNDRVTIEQATATNHPLPDDIAAAFVTDPPYYDAVPYAYLSDFFYVWMRRTLAEVHPSLFCDPSVPKDAEIVVDRPHQLSKSTKDIAFYERELTKAFAEGRRVLAPSGVGTIVFASKTTASWEAILKAVIDAGFIITGSWPIDTEMETRVAAQGQARLASSVHLVCRPREDATGKVRDDEIGDWRDVLAELPQRIHDWMPRLASEGVVGADAIFACLGPALEVFSRHSRVEKSNGDVIPLREYLEHVWAAVSHEALTMIFKDADAAGLEPDARLTAMWLWTLGSSSARGNGNEHTGIDEDESGDDDSEDESKAPKVSGFVLEFDAARKIAQGLGIHLEKVQSVAEVKGDKARLLPVAERTKYLFGKDSAEPESTNKKPKKKENQLTLFAALQEVEAAASVEKPELKAPAPGSTVLDRVHQAMILFAAGRGEALKRFLVEEGTGKDARFWKLSQSLSALYPSGIDEKRWVDGVLARKKSLGL
jgi:adenine-specific DNA methylase